MIPQTPAAASPSLEPPPAFSCPQCQSPVGAKDLACPTCGVSLAWAAALAERQVLASRPSAVSAPAAPALPRFGEFLLRRGNITEAQLQTALTLQRQAAASGAQQTVGQILFEMGAVTRQQLDQASLEQVKQLQDTLQESNRQLEQKVAERTRELQQALQQLSVLSDLKANFIANISHILRTPLTSIKGFSALLADGQIGPLSADQHKAVEKISQAAAGLEEAVNEIILFSPSLKSQVQLRRTRWALPEIAERLRTVFGPKAAASAIRLRFDLAAGLPLVWADAEKIRWTLFQLFDQALKFTPPGGEVALAAALAGQRVRVTVRDTAPGLPPDSLDDVFQPVPELPAQMVENAGLGLALVKRILEAHQAELRIESLADDGTLMTFELPTAEGA